MSEKLKILVTGEHVKEALLRPISDAGYSISYFKDLLSEEELSEQLKDSTGFLFGGDEYASAAALSTATTLKVISVLAVGYESFVDVPAVKAQNIKVTNTPGANTNSVAEFAVAHLLNARRQLGHYAETYRSAGPEKELKQNDLRDAAIGIVGLGAIGTRIAEILVNGFGCKVSYFSRTRKPELEEKLGLSYANLHDLPSQIDCLILATPGNSETANLIDMNFIEAVRQPITLVNISRPSVVSAEALLNGLESGCISTACFDGFYPEAEPFKKFESDRLVVTGHIAALTHTAWDAMTNMAVQSLLSVLKTGHDARVVT